MTKTCDLCDHQATTLSRGWSPSYSEKTSVVAWTQWVSAESVVSLLFLIFYGSSPSILNLPLKLPERTIFASHEKPTHQTINDSYAQPN